MSVSSTRSAATLRPLPCDGSLGCATFSCSCRGRSSTRPTMKRSTPCARSSATSSRTSPRRFEWSIDDWRALAMASIDKRPDGRYRARWREYAGGPQRSKHFDRKIDAEQHLVKTQHELLTGAYVDPAKARTTVEEFYDVWS